VMPRLSDSMDEGKLIEWKIRPGDLVKNGDVVAEVESDKAVMEIQTFKSGRVKDILIDPGSTVSVGTPMAVIDTDSTAKVTTEEVAQKAESGGDESKKQSTSETKITKNEESSEKEQNSQPPKTAATARTDTDSIDTAEQSPLDIILGISESSKSAKHSYTGGNSSPRARAEAAKYGLNIEKLQKEDKLPVPAHLANIKRYRLSHYFTPKALELMARYRISDELFDTGKKHDEKEILDYIQSHEIPLPQTLSLAQKSMITVVEEAAKRPVYHMSDFIDTGLIKKHESKELTVTVWLLKLFAEAMMKQRFFRMSLLDGSIQVWPNASISLAVADGDHLYMPVLRDINKKSPAQISQELQSIKSRVKERRLSKEDLSGSTFGLSNLGMTGVRQFDAMINKRDCAIAAIGSEIEGKIMVTLTVDHRIINGYQAAEFLQTLKSLAEDPLAFKE